MKKILITTDFSANSKAALRFASQLAAQSGATLTFLHVLTIQRPTAWNPLPYASCEKHELTKGQENPSGNSVDCPFLTTVPLLVVKKV